VPLTGRDQGKGSDAGASTSISGVPLNANQRSMVILINTETL
jgi:hypothetical protein